MDKTILIVDDDNLITNTLKILMKAALKLKVITCNDPVEALEVYKNTNSINAVISDFMMPNMDGIQFLKQIKNINTDAVTILLTGYSDKENAIKAINDIGIYHYIEKPWDNDNLIKIVQNSIEKDELSKLLKNKVEELEQSNNEIERLFSLLEIEHKKTLNQNEILEKMVDEKTKSIRTLMDNAGQGFMYFGKDLLIRAEYSSECARIFGDNLEGRNFMNILYPVECHEEQMYKYALNMLLDSEADYEELEQLYVPLLPNEFQIDKISIHIEYKPIRNMSENDLLMMVIVTDISQKKILEDEINKDRNKLAMIVNAFINRKELLESISEFKTFCMSVLDGMYYEGNINKTTVCIYRTVHNYKGIFSQFGLINTTQHLHELETELYQIKDSATINDFSQLKSYIESKNLLSYINEDINILTNTLGNDFLSSVNQLQISSEKLNEIKSKVLATVSPSKYPAIVHEFMELEMCSFKNMLNPFPRYTISLAGQLEKCIEPFELEGEDFMVDYKYYRPFVKSLVNVFRNMVYHGIEIPEERLESGKAEIGKVSCKIEKKDDTIIIEISDDGRGIDLDKLRKIAVLKGYGSEKEIEAWDSSRVLELIYVDGITVCETANMVAGRGEGMAEVKSQLDKIDGHMITVTEKNHGTVFKFYLPCKNHVQIRDVDENEIIATIVKASTDFLRDNNITTIMDTNIQNIECSKVDLGRYSSFLEIRGAFSGFVAISVQQPLGSMLIRYFLGEEDTGMANDEINEDCVCEFGNMMIGRSFEMLSCGERLVIDDTFSVVCVQASLKYMNSNIIKGVISTEDGDLEIILLVKG